MAYVYINSQFANDWRRLKHTSSLVYFLQQVKCIQMNSNQNIYGALTRKLTLSLATESGKEGRHHFILARK